MVYTYIPVYLQYQFKINTMAKEQVSWKFTPELIKLIKDLADKKGWSYQSTAEKAMFKGLKSIK